jgi:uncharacterized SAM-binding protein YcdF (DUF218 family)
VRRALLIVVALVAVGSVAAWYARVTLLQAAASWWIVSDAPEPSDAVAVFGGGLEDRPFVAADYYKRGLVKRIALSNIGHGPVEELGIEPSHVAANRAVMIKLGVPESAIETFGDDLKNTQEEATALHQWAAANGVRSIIVPTEIFTSRRLAWMLQQVFGGDAVIRVVALDPLGYNRKNWWRREAGLIGFQNEFIKYLYYRAEY